MAGCFSVIYVAGLVSSSVTTAINCLPASLLINYFDVIGNVEDTLEKEIASCPELVAMLEEADRMEKQQLMSDPQIAMIVQLGAESTGVSEVEYLDHLVKFLRNPPEGFWEKVQEGV